MAINKDMRDAVIWMPLFLHDVEWYVKPLMSNSQGFVERLLREKIAAQALRFTGFWLNNEPTINLKYIDGENREVHIEADERLLGYLRYRLGNSALRKRHMIEARRRGNEYTRGSLIKTAFDVSDRNIVYMSPYSRETFLDRIPEWDGRYGAIFEKYKRMPRDFPVKINALLHDALELSVKYVFFDEAISNLERHEIIQEYIRFFRNFPKTDGLVL